MTVVPSSPTRISTASQTRRASGRPIPPRSSAAGAAGLTVVQRPSSWISASAMSCPAIRSSSRAASDPYRTALVAISLTAITNPSACSGGMPACSAHCAVTRRTCRRSSMPNRIPAVAAIGGSFSPGRNPDPTPAPLPSSGSRKRGPPEAQPQLGPFVYRHGRPRRFLAARNRSSSPGLTYAVCCPVRARPPRARAGPGPRGLPELRRRQGWLDRGHPPPSRQVTTGPPPRTHRRSAWAV